MRMAITLSVIAALFVGAWWLSLRRTPAPDSPEALAEARGDTAEPVSPSPPRVEVWMGPVLTTEHVNIAFGVAAASAMTCIGWEACGPLPVAGEVPGAAEPSGVAP